MTTHRGPLVDLTRQQGHIYDSVRGGFNHVIAKSSFIGGPHVGDFEEAWAGFCATQVRALEG